MPMKCHGVSTAYYAAYVKKLATIVENITSLIIYLGCSTIVA